MMYRPGKDYNLRAAFVAILLIAVTALYGIPAGITSANHSSDSLGQNAYAQGEQASSSNPKTNSSLPTHSQYNVLAAQILSNQSRPLNQTLPLQSASETGLESSHSNDWITANHDIYYSRSSNQTIIGKSNVNQLGVKWIFNDKSYIESSPLIIGNRVYALDNDGAVLALDADTGLNLWRTDVGTSDQTYHGMTYDHGVLFVPAGSDKAVSAVNATTGQIIWKSDQLSSEVVNPPVVWKNFVLSGTAGGDIPTETEATHGMIYAMNRTNGHIIWSFNTTVGAWVSSNSTLTQDNGGGTSWSGGSIDPQSGTIFLPVGNASPDFNATGRPAPNNYTDNVIALDIKTGKLKWATPFLEPRTILSDVKLPDTHDWDTSWGTTLNQATINGTQTTLVVGTDKRGDIIAMRASDGKPLWTNTIGTVYNNHAVPLVNGSGEIWPGTQYGIEDYHAIDGNNNIGYFASSSMGFNFFVNATDGSVGRLIPEINSIPNGIGNGTITAIDLTNGKIMWQHKTEFPTWASPVVTNGIVFSGQVTAMGKPYTVNAFGAPIDTPLQPSGIVMALDQGTGKVLWEFNVGSPIGIGGPSVGHGMLLVPTGTPAETLASKGGSIVAFGPPSGSTSQASIRMNVTQGVLPGVDRINPNEPSTGEGPSQNNSTSTSSASQSNSTSTSSTNRTGTEIPGSPSCTKIPPGLIVC